MRGPRSAAAHRSSDTSTVGRVPSASADAASVTKRHAARSKRTTSWLATSAITRCGSSPSSSSLVIVRRRRASRAGALRAGLELVQARHDARHDRRDRHEGDQREHVVGMVDRERVHRLGELVVQYPAGGQRRDQARHVTEDGCADDDEEHRDRREREIGARGVEDRGGHADAGESHDRAEQHHRRPGPGPETRTGRLALVHNRVTSVVRRANKVARRRSRSRWSVSLLPSASRT